jgi:predicted P-loop ATPase
VVTRSIEVSTLPSREQIWAEARARYMRGESSWELSPRALLELEQRHVARTVGVSDTWQEAIRKHCMSIDRIQMGDLLMQALLIPTDRQDPRAVSRASRVLREMGWTQRRTKHGREWFAPSGWLALTAALTVN